MNKTPEQTTAITFSKLALSRRETAAVLGVSPITVDRLRKSGQLRASRATRRPLFPVFEIERFLRETMSPTDKVRLTA
jgi:hypothetical protein